MKKSILEIMLPKGLVPVVVTPFRVDGSLDYEAFKVNLKYLKLTGCAGVLVAGSIGEQPHLSDVEIERLTFLAREVLGERFPVIVGASKEGTHEALRLCELIRGAGASIAMVRAPSYYYADYTPVTLTKHFEFIADHSPIPILLYNSPEFVRTILPVEVVAALASHSNIVGIKECSGNTSYLAALVNHPSIGPSKVAVGFDPLLPDALSIGVKTAMMTLANIVPSVFIEILSAHQSNDIEKFRILWEKVQLLISVIFQRNEIAAIKAGMALVDLSGGYPRLPLVPVNETQNQEIASALTDLIILPQTPHRK